GARAGAGRGETGAVPCAVAGGETLPSGEDAAAGRLEHDSVRKDPLPREVEPPAVGVDAGDGAGVLDVAPDAADAGNGRRDRRGAWKRLGGHWKRLGGDRYGCGRRWRRHRGEVPEERDDPTTGAEEPDERPDGPAEPVLGAVLASGHRDSSRASRAGPRVPPWCCPSYPEVVEVWMRFSVP